MITRICRFGSPSRLILRRESIGADPAQVDTVGEFLLRLLIDRSEAHETTECLFDVIGRASPALIKLEKTPGGFRIVTP